jgi:4-hydroxy-3-methylbut-2-en-1-yl diphosphate synthase IspG/GcpE
MAAARESNAPRLEGVLLPPSDSTVEDRVRAAVPNIAVVLKRDDDPAPTVEDRNPRVWRVDPDWHLSPADAVVWYRDFGREPADLRVVLHLTLPADPDDALLYGAAVAGSLLCDGIGDAVRFGGPHEPERLLEMVLGVLQACRLRASRTEYIACPGCGRTLFDLESTTQRIKARTGHLPGVKIAVMGCIVNGPGEMADADFGYVGSLPGFVNLYVGKDIVERNVPSKDADERLIALLKSHGVWREPAAVAAT